MNCKHWKNEQAELSYSTFDGICTCFKWKFETVNDADIKILDRNNLSGKHMNVHRFESQSSKVPIGRVDKSDYCFVTDQMFGCIHFESRK